MEFEKLYTAEDVAQITGLTLRTIRNYIKDGKLKGRRIGVQWRFTAADIQALFDAPVPETAGTEPGAESAAEKGAVGTEAAAAAAVPAAVSGASQNKAAVPQSPAMAEAAITSEEETEAVPVTRQQAEDFLKRRKAPRSSACAIVDIPGVTEQEARFLFNRLQSLAAVYQEGPKRLQLSYDYDENREQARYVFDGALETACAMLNLCEVQ